MKVAVFFEGAGGATEGIRQAGHETVGYEYWDVAAATARANGHDCRLHDLSDPTRDGEIVDAGAAWFSPPCQPFSAAGDGAGEFDERDGLPWVLRILALRRYPVVFVENVKGLTFEKHRDYLGGFLLSLAQLGYRWEWRVLNCADYGVPQTRERWICVARLDDAPIVWPMPTHTEAPGMFTEGVEPMAEALGWGGELSYRRGEGMTERHGPRGPWDTAAIPAPTVHRNSEKDWVLNTHRDQRENGTTQTVELDRPAPAVTAVPAQWNWEAPGTDAIRLTIAELATLQGFPDGYIFTGTKTAQAKMIGNAVPPALARVLVEANLPAVGSSPPDGRGALPRTDRTRVPRSADDAVRRRTSRTAASEGAPSTDDPLEPVTGEVGPRFTRGEHDLKFRSAPPVLADGDDRLDGVEERSEDDITGGEFAQCGRGGRGHGSASFDGGDDLAGVGELHELGQTVAVVGAEVAVRPVHLDLTEGRLDGAGHEAICDLAEVERAERHVDIQPQTLSVCQPQTGPVA
jgi:DNA (cytosine-5)-methyltransferase 1